MLMPSLALLLLTYAVFGWLFASCDWRVWLLEASLVLLIALALTAPLISLQTCLTNLLQSDVRAFSSVILGAFGIVVMLCWIELFVRVLVLASAGALVRLDLQAAGYSDIKAFWILAMVSLAGLSVGLSVHLGISANCWR